MDIKDTILWLREGKGPTFRPRLDILPAAQRRLWDELGTTPPQFILYGGTAIALQLGHRQSVDFDFFSASAFNPQALLASVPYLTGARTVNIEVGTLHCQVDRGGPVRLSYFHPADFPQLELPLTAEDNGLVVASLRDLAVNKLAVIQQREAMRDYVDIHALIHQGGITLDDALVSACEAYGDRFAPLASLRALIWFEGGDLAGLPAAIRRDLTQAVAAVDLEELEDRIEAIEPEGPKR